MLTANVQKFMKKLLSLILLIGTLSVAKAQSTDDKAAQDELLALNRAWNTAVIQRDSSRLENLLAPEFTLNGALPRSVWINNTLHRLNTTVLETIGKESISIYGQSAICTSILRWKASFDGNAPQDGEYHITDIWKKNNGQWQVLIRMSRPK